MRAMWLLVLLSGSLSCQSASPNKRDEIPEIEADLRTYFQEQRQPAAVGAHAPFDETPGIAKTASR